MPVTDVANNESVEVDSMDFHWRDAMLLLKKLGRDDAGAVLSSELVLVGTLGVVGATVGLNAVATSVNEELEDVAFAIRSLDQSYEIRGVKGCGAWTAGSVFHQEPVKVSLRELDDQIDRDEERLERRIREQEQRDARDRREEMRLPDRREPRRKQEMKRPDKKKTLPKKKRPTRSELNEEVIL